MSFAVFLLLGMSGLSVAAPNQLTEEDLPVPLSVVGNPNRPAPRVPSETRVAPKPEASEPGQEVAKATRPPAANVTSEGGELSYTVRGGDSPGSIAEMFHVDVAALLHANHMRPDVILRIGETMRIPNPYAYEVSTLKAQVAKLEDQVNTDRRNAEAQENDVQAARSRAAELVAANRQLQHDTRILPRWRKAAMTASVAAAVMFGITALALLEWFLTRRRFRMLAEMNESFRQLDQKYKTLLAKAELRFQQIYGRRRHGIPEGQEPSKSPEDYQIEQLNRELKDVMERQLDRMGGRRNGHRHSWLRSLFGSFDDAVETRPTRR
ncbi:MAG: LysM peptidoglycan-binding domain-containing protein [Candidatus Binataceae bacterium]